MDFDSDCGPVDIWTCTKHSKDLEGTCVWLAGLGDLATSRGGGEVFFIQSFKIRGKGWAETPRKQWVFRGSVRGQTVYGTRTLSSKNTSLAERRGTRCEPGTAQLKAVG